ncbi:MAG: succinyl-diaminopimelate desuccinylase [Alphaproteobacteria bacterium]|nr:succinyl-diaminopimelate desuccinylase [Alphaproteobacteria bacterium]
MSQADAIQNQKTYDVLSLSRRLIRFRSVTPHGDGALDDLQALFSHLGFTCHRLVFSEPGTPDIDNLYARLGTKNPHFCFAGHIDVTPPGDELSWTFPPFEGAVHEGYLYGRGAADMKGGIAAFLAATSTFISQQYGNIPGSISFLITGDEEGPALNGSVKMLQWIAHQGETIDHCLVGEPTNPCAIGDMIKIGRRGSLSFTLTTYGKQGHIAHPHLAENPVSGMIHLTSALLGISLDNGTDLFEPSNLEFTTIDVNNPAKNVIPAQAMAQFNIRFNDIWTSQTLEKKIRTTLEETKQKNHLINYKLDCQSNAEAFFTPPDAFTKLIINAVQHVSGQQPELSTSGGTSDARFVRTYCPVVEFGLTGGTIHQVDECVRVADLYDLTAIYLRILESYFKLDDASSGASGSKPG